MNRTTILLSALLAITVRCASADPAIEDKSFIAADASTQQYVLVYPDAFDATKQHDVLIALHGHGSDRWQFVKDARDECRAARDAAARHNMIFVSPDYRAKTSWMGPAAEADMVQVIAEVKRAHPVGKVYICGGSMGGTSALIFTARHPELIAGVASMNGTANMLEYELFADAIRESYGGSKTEKPEVYKERSAELFPDRFTMPVGISAGGKDEIVPSASVVRLANALKTAQKNVLLVYREDGGHATNYEDATAILEYAITPTKTDLPAGK